MTHETLGALGAFVLIGGAMGGILSFTLAGLSVNSGLSPRTWLAGAAVSIILVVAGIADLLYEVPLAAR